MSVLMDLVNKEYQRNEAVSKFPDFRTGDTIAVYAIIKEGAKSRTQVFKGVCIAIKGEKGVNQSFKVRKTSNGIGVERTFPFHTPSIEKIEVVQRGKTRRSKLYYLRERSGKSARISVDYDRK